MDFSALSSPEGSQTDLDDMVPSQSQPQSGNTNSVSENEKQAIDEILTQIIYQMTNTIQDDIQKISPTQNQQQKILFFKSNEVIIQQQLELSSVIASIIYKYDTFMLFQKSLNDILKFSPKPQVIDVRDQNQQDYVDNIAKLKVMVFFLLDFPLKFNKLQNKFSHTSKNFDRIHVLLSGHISNLLKVTYNINQENLGSNFEKLNEVKKQLEECKAEGEELSEKLYAMLPVNSQIIEHFSTYFGQEIKDTSSYLETEQDLLKKQNNEMEVLLNNTLREYCQTELLILQKNATLKTHETTANLMQKDINDMQVKLKQLKENMEKKIQNDENSKEYYQKQLTNERDRLMKEKQAYLDKKTNDQNIRFTQYQQQLSNLNSKYPLGKMCSFIEKKYFHYYFIQHESGSFSNDHQYAVQGVTKFFDKIRPDDYLTYIKFDSSSYINIGKTLKRNISQYDFINRIKNCRAGGTNFMSAFQALLQQIQNYYNQEEYPIIIFITDGQDSSNLDSISSQILSVCQDLVFYTIGYGSVNEQCLKNITNKFNKSIGERKEINGKSVNLFYVKNTPDDLVQTMSQISQQQSQISIEDIKKAQEFLKESFETMPQTSEDYYSKVDESYNKKISLLNNQIKELITGNCDSIEKLKQTMQNDIQKQNEYINNLIQEQIKENQKIGACKEEIKQIKLQFLQKMQHDKKGAIEDINLEDEIEKKQRSIKDDFKADIDKSKQKILEIKQKIEQLQQEKETNIVEFGFQNIQHFKKFIDLFTNVKDAQSFYINLIQDLVSLIKLSILQNEAFDQAIKNSQTYLKESRKLDNQYHLFTQFKQMDDTIDPENVFESIKKVLFFVNSSIEEKCKDDPELLNFYHSLIRAVNLNEIIQQYVDKKREEQLEYINKTVIPEVIKNQPKELTKLQETEAKQNEKIRKATRKIKNLKDDLLETKDQSERKEIQDEIKDSEQDLKDLNKKHEETKNELEEIQYEFETENSDKIIIVNQVVFGLIYAVMLAFFKKKSQMAANPFYQLLNGSINFTKSLRGYRTLDIQSGFKS
ncbi:hypothetical protein ABPG72_010201 [Tetrahymena utriculariae]